MFLSIQQLLRRERERERERERVRGGGGGGRGGGDENGSMQTSKNNGQIVCAVEDNRDTDTTPRSGGKGYRDYSV